MKKNSHITITYIKKEENEMKKRKQILLNSTLLMANCVIAMERVKPPSM